MAAPVGHLTIKFNCIRFNSLGILFELLNTTSESFECTNLLLSVVLDK